MSAISSNPPTSSLSLGEADLMYIRQARLQAHQILAITAKPTGNLTRVIHIKSCTPCIALITLGTTDISHTEAKGALC